MSWFYAVKNQQLGPVSDEEFRVLVAQGVIGRDSLVWQEGMPDWVPFERSPAADSPTTNAGIICAGCQQQFRFGDVVRVGSSHVCAACQPAALSRLQSESGRSGTLAPSDIERLDYEPTAFDCIGRGFRSLLQSCLPIYGTTMLFVFVLGLVGIVSIHPIVEIVLSGILGGPVVGGYWNYMIRTTRNESPAVGDAFAGFGPPFMNLLLGYIVPSVLGGLFIVPGIFILFIGLALGVSSGMPAGPIIVFGAVLGFAGLLAFIYYSTCWFHVLGLVIDKRMGFWPAMGLSRTMVRKHWWSNFMIGIIVGPLTFGPIIALNALMIYQTIDNPSGFDPLTSLSPVMAMAGLASIAWAFVLGPWLFSSYAHRYNDMFGQLAVQNDY
jgi:hypothetical protein